MRMLIGLSEIVAVDFNDLLLLEETIKQIVQRVLDFMGGERHDPHRSMNIWLHPQRGSKWSLCIEDAADLSKKVHEEDLEVPRGVASVAWTEIIFARLSTHLLCIKSFRIEANKNEPRRPDTSQVLRLG